MQIKVNQAESESKQVKVFIDSFLIGQEAARKAWGE